MKIDIIAGARPNFMKIAPIIDAIENSKSNGNNIEYRLVHTGQHYDKNMSGSFFEELGIPEPHINLESGGGSQAEQTAAIMIKFEEELLKNPADIVIVVGDVTSTLACSIVAKKLCVDVAHVEGGKGHIAGHVFGLPLDSLLEVRDRLVRRILQNLD